MKTLEPCPWCNETPSFVVYEKTSQVYVRCISEQCNISPWSRYYNTKIEAGEAWNNIQMISTPRMKEILENALMSPEEIKEILKKH